jgi:hypothetical protein
VPFLPNLGRLGGHVLSHFRGDSDLHALAPPPSGGSEGSWGDRGWTQYGAESNGAKSG